MAGSTPGDFDGTDRFLIEGRLGAGGFGVVYKAVDRERNTVVALKVLRHVAPKSLYRFKQEFRALADVSHPNLVTLYELSSDADEWFFTMELIDGVSFLRYVRDHGDAEKALSSDWSTFTHSQTPPSWDSRDTGDGLAPALDLGRLRAALPQLVDGVRTLHAAGKLHRDLKPSNVLVTREGRVTVLDFGLIQELNHRSTMESSGTPAYMSPEQAAGQPLTEASDWYNVGSMLFEALTGRLPFLGKASEIVREKQRVEPPAPIELCPDVPADLDALCRDLVRHDPHRRPTGAEIDRRLRGAASPRPAPTAGPGAPPVAPFVGRRPELEALWDAFRAMKDGRTVTVSVQGGSAIGKSALVRRFLDELREAEDTVILAGRCYERESVPYKALDSLVDALSQYLRRLPSAQTEALLPHDTYALLRLFPVLRQVRAVAEARRPKLDIPDSQELRRRAFGALRELVVRLADRKPLVLFIDDLHWGDIDSAALLEALLRPPDPPALLLVGCFRGEEASTSPFLQTLLRLRQSAGPALTSRDIALGELGADEARELAMAHLAGAGPETTARAEGIARESGGNPYFIEELSRFARSTGIGGPMRDGPGKAPSLNTVIESRVLQLPGAARRLLDVVAVAGQPLEVDVAYRSAELENDGRSVLAILRVAHLVRTRTTQARDEIETYHDRIRVAVVAQLAPAELRECHQRLAAALVAGRSDPERLAAHFLGAGDAQSAAEYAAQAAAEAAKALAFDRAASLYRFALTLRTEAGREVGDLPISLGDALANAGRGAEAAQAYLSAVPGASTTLAIDLQRRAAQQYLTSGHIEDGLRVLDTVLEPLAMMLPRTPRGALFSLLRRRAFILLRGLAFKARDVSEVSPQKLIRIDTCWAVAVGLAQFDMLRAADFQTRNLVLSLQAGEPYRVARALILEVAYLAMGGSRSRRRTDRLLQEAQILSNRVGHPHALGSWALMNGVAAWMDGRWKAAHDSCESAEAQLRERCTGVVWDILMAQMFQLASLFFLGKLKELSVRLPLLLEEAEERGDLLRATFLRIGYSSHVAWLAADDPEKARRELGLGLAKWRQGRFDYLQMWARSARTDISLYTGEQLVDDPVATRFRPFARSLDRFVQVGFIRGRDSRARRRLALAAQSPDRSRREKLLRGAEAHAEAILRERTRWAEPLAQVVQASAARMRGETARATRLLSSAEATFAGLDMALYEVVARRRRGEVVGGTEGSGLVAAADGWMREQGIVNPERMTQVLAPGRWKDD